MQKVASFIITFLFLPLRVPLNVVLVELKETEWNVWFYSAILTKDTSHQNKMKQFVSQAMLLGFRPSLSHSLSTLVS